ncbi:MAG: hypothetical protein ACRQFF_01920 [Sphaerochaeta sp.]
MIKKNKIGLLVLALATTLILSGCSQDAYSGFFSFMSGNTYSDGLGITLPGASADDAVEASDNATDPTEETVEPNNSTDNDAALATADDDDGLDDNSGEIAEADFDDTVDSDEIFGIENKTTTSTKKTVTAISSKAISDTSKVQDLLNKSGSEDKIFALTSGNETDGYTVKVPVLEENTDAEKEALVASYSTKNETKIKAIKESLKEKETDSTKLIAAHNTKVVIDAQVEALDDTLEDASGLDGDVVDILKDLTDAILKPTLSDEPTKEEILRVQLAYNLSKSITKAILALDEDGADIGDADVVSKFTSAIADAETAVTVANINSDNGDLISGFDFASLISTFTGGDDDDDEDKSITAFRAVLPEDSGDSEESDEESMEEINSIIEGNRSTIKMIMKNYIGIEKSGDVYVYNEELNDDNVASNEVISSGFSTFIDSVSILGNGEDTRDADLRVGLRDSKFVGLDGILGYTLTFLLDNIDSGLVNLKEYYNDNNSSDSDYATVKEFVDAYLVNHTEIFDAIYNGGDVDVEKFSKIDSDSTDDPILEVLMGSEDAEIMDLLENMFTVEGGEIVELHNFFDGAKQIDLTTDGGLGVIADAFDDAYDSLIEFEQE